MLHFSLPPPPTSDTEDTYTQGLLLLLLLNCCCFCSCCCLPEFYPRFRISSFFFGSFVGGGASTSIHRKLLHTGFCRHFLERRRRRRWERKRDAETGFHQSCLRRRGGGFCPALSRFLFVFVSAEVEGRKRREGKMGVLGGDFTLCLETEASFEIRFHTLRRRPCLSLSLSSLDLSMSHLKPILPSRLCAVDTAAAVSSLPLLRSFVRWFVRRSVLNKLVFADAISFLPFVSLSLYPWKQNVTFSPSLSL